jgi:hypothetical protein
LQYQTNRLGGSAIAPTLSFVFPKPESTHESVALSRTRQPGGLLQFLGIASAKDHYGLGATI